MLRLQLIHMYIFKLGKFLYNIKDYRMTDSGVHTDS